MVFSIPGLHRAPAAGGKKPARERFHVTMNRPLAEDLQRLADEACVDRDEIFMRAIATYAALKTNEKRGFRVVLKDRAGAEQALETL
jgi:metal-responsive CopG/Arc/MetJ family transcriptional regulator